MLALLAISLFALPPLLAQEIPSEVASAFQKGNAELLAGHLGDNASVVLQGKPTNAGKQQATDAMRRFFADNKVSGFTTNHEGKRDESSFLVGTLATAKGKFRVNCFLRKVRERYLIYQIRIDNVND
jgi:hypothetical protein